MRFEDEQPINKQERYLHGINVRLEALIAQVTSIVEVLAKQNGVATTQVVEQVKTTRTKKVG